MKIMKKKNLFGTSLLTLALFLGMELCRFATMMPVVYAQEDEGPPKKVAVFVLPASTGEAQAALTVRRILRESVAGLTGVDLVAPAPVTNAAALPDLVMKIESAYLALNGKRVPEAMEKLNAARPLLEQVLPIVPVRTVAMFYKAYGVAQGLQGKMLEAKTALEISLTLWREQNNLEYAYSVEVLKLYSQVTSEMERRPNTLLKVSSTPDNAVVVVDNREPMRTPTSVSNLPEGQHLVKVVMDGYEQWAGFVNVKAGVDNVVNVPLKAIAEKDLFDQRLVGVAGILKKDRAAAGTPLAELREFLGADELLALECSVVGQSFELKGFHVKADDQVFEIKRTLARDANFLAMIKEFLSGLFESFYEIARKTEGLGGPPIDPVILQKAGITSQQTATVFDPDNPVFPNVDLGKKRKDDDSIFGAWWFWVGVGVVVAGGVAGGIALATSDSGGGEPTGTLFINTPIFLD